MGQTMKPVLSKVAILSAIYCFSPSSYATEIEEITRIEVSDFKDDMNQIWNSIRSRIYPQNKIETVSKLYDLTNKYMEAYSEAVEIDREAKRMGKEQNGVSLKMKDVVMESSQWYKMLLESEKKNNFIPTACGEIPYYPPFYLVMMMIQNQLSGNRELSIRNYENKIEFILPEGKVYLVNDNGVLKFSGFDLPGLSQLHSQQLI